MASSLTEKMNLVKAQLELVAPTRIVTRSYKDFEQHRNNDLKTGILTVISSGEDGYANSFARHAETSNHPFIIAGQIKLAGNASGEDVENAEFEMVEDVKALVRSALPPEISTLELKRFKQSGQLLQPNGWIVCELVIDELRSSL